MKKIIYSSLFIILFISKTNSQTMDSLIGFDEKFALEHTQYSTNNENKTEYLNIIKRNWLKQKYDLTNYNYSKAVSVASNCSNLDFEQGNTSGWLTTGLTQIVSMGTDSFGGFSKVYPGGNFSLKIGSDWSASSGTCLCTSSSVGNFCSSSASRTIGVTASNSQFILHYAFVFHNYPHNWADAAQIKVSVLNSSSVTLACPSATAYYTTGINHFDGLNNVVYSTTSSISGCTGSYPATIVPWNSMNIDLSPYVGQTITLKISPKWCQYQSCWAYAYIDAECSSISNNTLVTLCTTGSNYCAPSGFSNYTWTSPSTSTINTQCFTPTVYGTYTLNCAPSIACSNNQNILLNVQTCTGINNNTFSNENFNIYPNPTNNILNIKTQNMASASSAINDYNIKITNTLGQLIQTISLQQPTTQINVSELPGGIYFLQVFNAGNLVRTSKFVKE